MQQPSLTKPLVTTAEPSAAAKSLTFWLNRLCTLLIIASRMRLTNNDDRAHGVVWHQFEDRRQEQQDAHHNNTGHKACQGCPCAAAVVDGTATEAACGSVAARTQVNRGGETTQGSGVCMAIRCHRKAGFNKTVTGVTVALWHLQVASNDAAVDPQDTSTVP